MNSKTLLTAPSRRAVEDNVYVTLPQWNLVGIAATNGNKPLIEIRKEAAASFRFVAESTPEVACLSEGVAAEAAQ